MIWRREDAEAAAGDRPRSRRSASERTSRWRTTVRSRSSVRAHGWRATSCRPAACGSTARSRARSTPTATSALSPQSQVEADIRAQNVSVAGRFTGNIVVKDTRASRARRPDRRQHHVEDPRGRRGRRVPRAEHHGRRRLVGFLTRIRTARVDERGHRGEEGSRPGKGVRQMLDIKKLRDDPEPYRAASRAAACSRTRRRAARRRRAPPRADRPRRGAPRGAEQGVEGDRPRARATRSSG